MTPSRWNVWARLADCEARLTTAEATITLLASALGQRNEQAATVLRQAQEMTDHLMWHQAQDVARVPNREEES